MDETEQTPAVQAGTQTPGTSIETESQVPNSDVDVETQGPATAATQNEQVPPTHDVSGSRTEPHWVTYAKAHPLFGSGIVIVAVGLALLGGAASFKAVFGSDNSTTDASKSATQPATTASDTRFPELQPSSSPERTTFTGKTPAPKPVLNSITDNPDVGSELLFTRVRAIGDKTLNNVYVRELPVRPGDTIEVSVFVGNDASVSLGDAGTIDGLAVLVAAETGRNGALLHADLRGWNVDHVEDSALISADQPLKLSFIHGSAEFRNSSGTHRVSDGLGQTSWVKLGSTALDGTMRVGLNPDTNLTYDYGYLIFRVKAEAV